MRDRILQTADIPAAAKTLRVGDRVLLSGTVYTARDAAHGRLFAALDVFEQEPIPAEDPFWTCPNLLITPHVAGNMTLPYTVRRITEMFLEDLDNYCAGRPLKRRVNVRRGY